MSSVCVCVCVSQSLSTGGCGCCLLVPVVSCVLADTSLVAGHSKWTTWNTSFAVFLVPTILMKVTGCWSNSTICHALHTHTHTHTHRALYNDQYFCQRERHSAWSVVMGTH